MRDGLVTNGLAPAFPRELTKTHSYYDQTATLVTRTRPSDDGDGDPTTVHALRPSLSYGVALLDTGDPHLAERAHAVIAEVLCHQETDPKCPYYGCWPYDAEGSLSDGSPVDLNWAAFLGRELVYLLADHPDRLPGDLDERVERALDRAAACIDDRTVIPGYTNIATMSAYVLVMAGTLLGDDARLAAGRQRLRELVGYTRYHDGFTEYNSPTYTVITLGEVGRMLGYFEATADRALARVLNDYAWRSIATHYHPPTARLAGPHSRAYDDEFHDDEGGTSLRSIIAAGTGGAFGVDDEADLEFFENEPPLDLNWHKTVLDCPVAYYGGFDVPGPAFVRDRFYDGAGPDQRASDLTPHEAPGPIEARTFLSPALCLGTFTRSHCWEQRRPLVGYWGSPTEPHYVRLRCLRDGSDYRPAMVSTSQYETHVVGGVSFLTDYADAGTHDDGGFGSIRADSLVVRFEVGTDFSRSLEDIEVRHVGENHGLVRAGNVTIDVFLLASEFGTMEPVLRSGSGSDSPAVRESTWMEVVLYEGEQTMIDFESLANAVVVFGLSLRSADDRSEWTGRCAEFVAERTRDGTIEAWIPDPAFPNSVTVPTTPCSYAEYFERTAIDDRVSGTDGVQDSH